MADAGGPPPTNQDAKTGPSVEEIKAKLAGKPTPAAAKVAAPPTPPPVAPVAPKPAPAATPAAPLKPAVVPAPPRPKTVTEDISTLMEKWPGAFTHLEDTDPKIPTVQLGDRTKLLEVAAFLQKDRAFEHLALITAVDYKTHLEMVYNFWSYSKNVPIEVKVRLDLKDAKIPSLTSLWATADWHERENWDLMGVTFDGHPDLRRILLPEGWKGHPLRKDYEWKKEQYVGLDPTSGEDLVFPEPREGAW